MIATLAQILNWFRTGLKPNQTQWQTAWSSFWHKQDAIPMSSISDLSTTLQTIQNSINNVTNGGAPTAVAIPANGTLEVGLPLGKLTDNFVILSATTQTVTLQISHLPEPQEAIVCELQANVPYLIGIGIYVAADNVAAAVEVTVTGAVTLLIYKR